MSLGSWSVQPALIYVALAAALYVAGGRGGGANERRRATTERHELFFAAGLLVIVLALDSPLDALADKLFWAHMLQHILLLTLAPPLILLGRPWPRMWRALPLETADARRPRTRSLAARCAAAPARPAVARVARVQRGTDPLARARRCTTRRSAPAGSTSSSTRSSSSPACCSGPESSTPDRCGRS